MSRKKALRELIYAPAKSIRSNLAISFTPSMLAPGREIYRRFTWPTQATISTVLLIASAWPLRAANGQAIKSVFVKDSEIYVTASAGGRPQQLTHDGLAKSLPAWSPNGARIAFIRTSEDGAMAHITVMSSAGKAFKEISFRPAEASISGMRFVEDLQWLSEQRLMVSGSVNPSTGEYAVVDLATGKEVDWYATDGFTLAVSPNGKHVAYEGTIPHFIPEEQRRPRLCFDQECDPAKPGWPGYPAGSERHIEFASCQPVWSPEGTAVAILGQDYQTNNLFLLIRPLEGKATEYPLPSDSPDHSVRGCFFGNPRLYAVAWAGKTVLVKSADTVWKLEPKGSALIRIDPGQFRSDTSLQLREAETRRLTLQGAMEVDSWCVPCPVTVHPRRQGTPEAQ